MAEFLFKKMVADKGQTKLFEIASAATSQEEIGNGVYPPVFAMLKKMGIDASKKKARQITKKDFDVYDFIIVMDNNNLRNLDLMFNGYGEEKVHKCLDFSSRMGCDIADPWYTRDFDATYNDLMEGLSAFYDTLVENGMVPSK